MKKFLLTSAITLLMFSGAASAADITDVPADSLWTSGVYLGVSGGALWGSTTQKFRDGYWEGDSSYPDVDSDNTSYILGGQVGLNYVIDHFLLGVEGDISATGFDASKKNAMYDSGKEPWGDEVGQAVDWLGTARLRAGLVYGNALFYATGGLAVTSGDVTLKDGSYHDGGNTDQLTATGWTLGGGLEYKYTENVSLKAEYLYVSTSGKASTTCNTQGCYDEGDEGEVFKSDNDFHANIARVGVNYSF